MLREDSKIKIRGKNGKLAGRAVNTRSGAATGCLQLAQYTNLEKNKIKLYTHKPNQTDTALDRFLKSWKF